MLDCAPLIIKDYNLSWSYLDPSHQTCIFLSRRYFDYVCLRREVGVKIRAYCLRCKILLFFFLPFTGVYVLGFIWVCVFIICGFIIVIRVLPHLIVTLIRVLPLELTALCFLSLFLFSILCAFRLSSHRLVLFFSSSL